MTRLQVVRAELSDLIDEYLDHVKAARSPNTLHQYRYALKRVFLSWAEQEGLGHLAEIDRAALDRFSRHLQTEPGLRGRPLTPVSVQTYVRAINLWLSWSARHAGGEKGLRAEAPKPRRRTMITLSLEDVSKMEQAAKYPRDQLIVRLLADTGIRVGELINLRVRDLVREQSKCYLHVRGKTGGRIIGVEPALYRRLRAYVEGGRRDGGEDAPLFVALRARADGQAEPLTPSGVHQIVQYLGEAAGIHKRVYPHLFRHSYATEFLNRGGDSIMLAKVLGHGSLAMIQNVYAHLAADHVHDAMLRHLVATRKR